MLLPQDLREAIALLTSSLSSLKEKKEASSTLSFSYKHHPEKGYKAAQNTRLAYLLTRLPATFSVLCHVYILLKQRARSPIKSILDMGAGPATLFWALREIGYLPERLEGIEQDDQMIQIGRQLLLDLEPRANMLWSCGDILTKMPNQRYELIHLSYVLNELGDISLESFFERIEKLAENYLVFVESGTPKGYESLMRIRDKAIASHWNILAPCPHLLACPLRGKKSWCHFYSRVQRTKDHKEAKGGSLGYEDEKYSFLILSRHLPQNTAMPILNFPNVQKGFVEFSVCHTQGDIQTIRTMHKDKEAYKKAKKLSWGDFY